MCRLLAFAALAGAALIVGCAPSQVRDDRAIFESAFTSLEAGQWQRAIDGFSQYLRSNPTTPTRGEVYYYRGEALVHLKRAQEAMADFQRAVGAEATQPILQFARVAIGNLYYEQGNDAKAVEAYAEVLKGPQEGVPMDMLLLRLGVSLQRMGRWAAADRYLGLVIERYPATLAAAEARRRYKADSFAVQMGAYSTLSAAQQEAERLRAAGYVPRFGTASRNGQTLHTVQVGKARTYAEAQGLAQGLAESGFTVLIVP